MTVTINERELVCSSCYPKRYENGKQTITFTVSKDEIEHDELFDLVKNNTDDIICESEAGTTVYSGYGYTLTILTTEDNYVVEVECISDVVRKLNALQAEVDDNFTFILDVISAM